jgi:hypothetical protein
VADPLECLRCGGKDVRYRDVLDAPFCAPCATVVAVTSPDVLPMRPIEETDHA